MISNLGHISILLSLLVCAVGVPLGFAAGAYRSDRGLALTRRLAVAFGGFMAVATLLMEVALVRHDFSVSYVASVGSRSTPLHITIVSLWSSLEGSILFWGFILGLFTTIVALQRRDVDHEYLGFTLGTLFAVGLFFSFLIAGPADPFRPTLPPVPGDGPGPNPLLQNHVLMIIHPPALYLGYVGMAVPFAMAMAALIRGRLGGTWLRPLRNWLLLSTSFLTLGILLGGWWSYEVLGWGGYWAWDPVENASFLPWLTAVAALHSALVLQRRGGLRAWTVILVLVSFLLTILGTFLTRSGVVNSVHSFTQSPIGPLFLGFLAICLVVVVILLALRIDVLASDGGAENALSRGGTILVNNLLLVVFTFTVLVGTLFPILAEAVRGVKVSVGEPYFNRMAVPIGFGLLMLLGIGPALPWGRPDRAAVSRSLIRPLPAAFVGLVLTALFLSGSWSILLSGFLAGYAMWVTGERLWDPVGARRARGEKTLPAVLRASARSPRRVGGYLSHAGVVIVFLAIAVSSSYQESFESVMRPGGVSEAGPYQLRFGGLSVVEESHRTVQKARVQVEREGQSVAVLEPSLNHYPTRMEPLGSPAVRSTLTHDLYLTVMNVGADGTVGLRAIVTPGVYWVWIGSLLVAVGMALCLVPGVSLERKEPAGS